MEDHGELVACNRCTMLFQSRWNFASNEWDQIYCLICTSDLQIQSIDHTHEEIVQVPTIHANMTSSQHPYNEQNKEITFQGVKKILNKFENKIVYLTSLDGFNLAKGQKIKIHIMKSREN